MWQLSEAIDGMGEACRAFGIPVVGGNVSLYNESAGQDIDPTPVVGVVGIVDDLHARPPGTGLVPGGVLVAIGPEPTSLAGSRWAWSRGMHSGSAPDLDLDRHAEVASLVRQLVVDGVLSGVHDTADGIGVALAEMVVRSRLGVVVARTGADHGWLFAESASRVVACVAADRVDDVLRAAQGAGVEAARIGEVTGDRLVVSGLVDVPVEQVVRVAEGRMPAALGAGTTH
jgi:phosphoribosylformylglycinamidine synthase